MCAAGRISCAFLCAASGHMSERTNGGVQARNVVYARVVDGVDRKAARGVSDIFGERE